MDRREMKLPPIPRTFTRTIAERYLHFVVGSHWRRVRIRVGAPVQDVTTVGGRDWRCPVQITGLGVRQPKRGIGADSLQALVHALKIVEEEINAAQKKRFGKFVWFGEPWHGVPAIQLTLPDFRKRLQAQQPPSRPRRERTNSKPGIRTAPGAAAQFLRVAR